MHARWMSIGAASLVLVCGAAGAADGLASPDRDALWPTWQARLTLTASHGQGLALAGPARLRQAALLGDYYLAAGAADGGWRGGLRATGGLVLGHLGHGVATAVSPLAFSLLSVDDGGAPEARIAGARPYVGLGYSGQSVRGGWGFSADVGVLLGVPADTAALGLGGPGTESVDDALRRIRLAPIVRLGVRYAF